MNPAFWNILAVALSGAFVLYVFKVWSAPIADWWDSESRLLKKELRFCELIERTRNLPDYIGNQRAFIFRNLIVPWIRAIMARHRYERTFSGKVSVRAARRDVIRYMRIVAAQSTDAFLNRSSTADPEIIEDALAELNGPEAVSELKRVRDLSALDFTDCGFAIKAGHDGEADNS